MRDETFMRWMRLLPKAALSSAVGAATRLPAPRPIHRAAMRAFAARYRVDLTEAEHPLEGYATFSEFFSRGLKAGAREVAGGDRVVVSPVDGTVSQAGHLEAGTCVQAKDISFPVARLLGDEQAARPFEGGAFATLYLSPRDYHRIHAPLSGLVEGWSYIPGQFWPVNRASVRHMPALFCLNERLITHVRTPVGRMAVVKVGATCVARIRASYDAVVTHAGPPRSRERRFDPPLPVRKGEELGRFEMGSTVILLFERGAGVAWDPWVQPEAPVRMGQRMGEAR